MKIVEGWLQLNALIQYLSKVNWYNTIQIEFSESRIIGLSVLLIVCDMLLLKVVLDIYKDILKKLLDDD